MYIFFFFFNIILKTVRYSATTNGSCMVPVPVNFMFFVSRLMTGRTPYPFITSPQSFSPPVDATRNSFAFALLLKLDGDNRTHLLFRLIPGSKMMSHFGPLLSFYIYSITNGSCIVPVPVNSRFSVFRLITGRTPKPSVT